MLQKRYIKFLKIWKMELIQQIKTTLETKLKILHMIYIKKQLWALKVTLKDERGLLIYW